MKIVRLGADRVRVFISESDLSHMNMGAEEISAESPKLSSFLYGILETVKEETGFTLGDGKVIAEATPEAGGIILEFIELKKEIKIKKECAVFEFANFDALEQMLRHVGAQYLFYMRLYSHGKKFYMAVPKRRVPALIYEYSLSCQKSPIAENRLTEHGRLIAGGYRLISMAAALKKIN